MKKFTVVGKYDDDTDQPFVFHVEAPSIEEAKNMTLSMLENENATICGVFAGHITGASDDESSDAIAELKLIGNVAVDSGQLLITDPGYIDSNWVEEPFGDIRRYRAADGRVLEFRKDFTNYEQSPEGFGGKTVNELLVNQELVQIDQEKSGRYSYNGCCQATTGAVRSGELKFPKNDIPGAGVVFRSGYGDGYYPVFGFFDQEGRIVKVLIDMQ